jgi:phosphoglycolate phosphatase
MLTQDVIFDLDGTLTDPREGITRSYAHTLDLLGYPVPELSSLTRFIGPPTREVLAELLGTQDSARIEQGVAIYRERFGEVGLFENEPYAGMNELLATLAQRGHTLWVCTSKPTVYAQRIAEHFGFMPSLRAVYGCELDGTRADKADLLAYLLERESIPAQHAVMIGDRLHDIRAARACGVRSIGVLYGFGSREELTQAGADHLCATVTELAHAIARLG